MSTLDRNDARAPFPVHNRIFLFLVFELMCFSLAGANACSVGKSSSIVLPVCLFATNASALAIYSGEPINTPYFEGSLKGVKNKQPGARSLTSQNMNVG